MTMSKLNQILIALLVIQIGLGVFTLWPQTTTAEAGEPLLSDLTAADISELVISDGNDNRIALSKQGDTWVLPEAGDFPADGEKINPLLEQLTEDESGRLVTQTDGSHARLQVAVENFDRRVEITRQDGRSDTLYLGSAAGAGATHVRVNDQAEVYLTGAVTSFAANAQASGWIDTEYFTIPQSTTTTITLENENGTFTFVRAGEGWSYQDLGEGETLNQTSVTGLLNQTHSIRMTAPVGLVSEAGSLFDDPTATITIEATDQTYRLQLGALNNGTNNYLLMASTSPHYVQIDKFTGDNFTTKTHDDFLEVQPEEDGVDTN